MLKHFVKNAFYTLSRLLAHDSLECLFKKYFRNTFPIFLFHDVTDSPSAFSKDFQLYTKIDIFNKQVNIISKYFKILAPNKINNIEKLKSQAMITFDDGFSNVFKNAAPLLNEKKIPFTVFMNMEMTVSNNPFWSGLITYLFTKSDDFKSFLKLKDIKIDSYHNISPVIVNNFISSLTNGKKDVLLESVRSYHGSFPTLDELENLLVPNCYLGNHLYNHYNAAVLPLKTLQKQFEKNEALLAKLGHTHSLFAYPFGQHDCLNKQTHDLLRSLGAKKIFTAINRTNKRDQEFILDRISMPQDIQTEKEFRAYLIRTEIMNTVRSLT